MIAKWKAEEHESFYYIVHNGDGVGVERASSPKQASFWIEAQHKVGNYFKTQEQAEEVAKAIRAVFELVHIPFDESTTRVSGNHIKNLAEQARKAVQL